MASRSADAALHGLAGIQGAVGDVGGRPSSGLPPTGIYDRYPWYNPYVPTLFTPSMMDTPHRTDGMTKLWTGRNGFIDDHAGDDTFDYSIFEVSTPATLLRSLVWVTWQGYNLYDIGGSGIPLGPLGYAFGDLNGRNNHNEFPPNNSPGNDKTELVAYDEVAPCYTALGWPPNTTGHLTGQVSGIASDADWTTVENLNTYMYTSARSFVDSQAQRIFDVEPEFRLVLQFFGGISTFVQGSHHVNITIRQLWSF